MSGNIADSVPVTTTPKEAAPPVKQKSTIKQLLWMTAASASMPLSTFITGPIIARALGPEGRGAVSAVLAPYMVLSVLAAIGLTDAVTYFVAKGRASTQAIMRRALLLNLAMGVLTAAIMWPILPLMLRNEPQLVPLARAVMCTLPLLLGLAIIRSTTAGERRFDLLNRDRWAHTMLRLALIVGLAVTGMLTVESAVWVTVVVPLLVVVVMWPVITSRTKGSDPRPAALTKDLTGYGLKSWVGTAAYLVNYRIDQALMVPLVGARQLGYYAVAVSLAEVTSLLYGGVREFLLPEATRRGDPAFVARAARLSGFITAVVSLIGCALAGVVVKVLFGDEFAPAADMARLLFLASIAPAIGSCMALGLMSLNRPGLRSVAEVIAGIVTLVGIFVLVPRVGAIGAAITSLVAYWVAALIGCVTFCRVSKVPLRDVLIPNRSDVTWLTSRAKQVIAKRRT